MKPALLEWLFRVCVLLIVLIVRHRHATDIREV